MEDVNDMPPLFKQRKYEGFMSSDLSRLRNNLQVTNKMQYYIWVESFLTLVLSFI